MMKLKMSAVACAVTYLISCTGVAGRAWGQDVSCSPINMGGGSIYINAENTTSWKQNSSGQYTAQTDRNIGHIYTAGIKIKHIPPLNGWVITIANRKPNGSRAPDAIKICSDQTCSGKSLDQTGTIYISNRSDTRWTVDIDKDLRFHDNACDKESGNGEDPTCDFFYDVTITGTASGTAYMDSGACQRRHDKGHCEIGIGDPPRTTVRPPRPPKKPRP